MTSSTTPGQVVGALRRYGLPVLVIVTAFILALDSYNSTAHNEQESTRNRFQLVAQQQIAQLRQRTDDLVSQADLLQRHIALAPLVKEPGFEHFVAPILELHPA
jgi:cell division protein FtsB